ncbi:MAG: class I SAM-dependent methyltransferase [Anaerolineales bacterium]
MTDYQPSEQAAERGEPSYVWRDGQHRRLEMILDAAGERIKGKILEPGCGVGLYLEYLIPFGGKVFGSEFDLPRAHASKGKSDLVLGAAGEYLPFPTGTFDLILSNEVIEHVVDDQLAIQEMIRVLKPGGRLILFCPNRWYPFETHGIYWRGTYRFGNKALINYLPRPLRNRLAPHVRVYSRRDLDVLFRDLPVEIKARSVIFGGYDNIIYRFPRLGRGLRFILYTLEKTPLRVLGLSHFWVIEKTKEDSYG